MLPLSVPSILLSLGHEVAAFVFFFVFPWLLTFLLFYTINIPVLRIVIRRTVSVFRSVSSSLRSCTMIPCVLVVRWRIIYGWKVSKLMTHELEVKLLLEKSSILSVTILCAFMPVTYELFLSVTSCSDQAMGWTIPGSIHGIAFSRERPDRLWDSPSLLFNCTLLVLWPYSSQGVKWSEHLFSSNERCR
jgi:hypothetical protein